MRETSLLDLLGCIMGWDDGEGAVQRWKPSDENRRSRSFLELASELDRMVGEDQYV